MVGLALIAAMWQAAVGTDWAVGVGGRWRLTVGDFGGRVGRRDDGVNVAVAVSIIKVVRPVYLIGVTVGEPAAVDFEKLFG